MPLRIALAFLIALITTTLSAQTPAQLKQELKTREAAAKKDPDALYEVGKWAAEKALAAEAKRLYQAVLKMKSDHAGANEGLGNELLDGKWLPAKEVEAVRKKAQAAEFAAKGLVEVDGIWVEKDKVAEAKRGVFTHEGGLVTRRPEITPIHGMNCNDNRIEAKTHFARFRHAAKFIRKRPRFRKFGPKHAGELTVDRASTHQCVHNITHQKNSVGRSTIRRYINSNHDFGIR